MSVEASRHINPFIKAKLQEHGIISLKQLEGLLCKVHGSSRVNPSVTHGSVPNTEPRYEEVAQQQLRELIPSLTAEEAIYLLQANLFLTTNGAGASVPENPHGVNTSTSPSTGSTIQFVSLAELKEEERKRQRRGDRARATTFCRSLDELLDGGVPLGEVTEITGPPGAGKTQLLMQLAVSCTLPLLMGGLGGSCIYLDTEGSFVPERFFQIVSAAVSLITNIVYSMKLSSMNGHDTSEKQTNPRKREREEKDMSDLRSSSSSSMAPVSEKASKALSRSLDHYTVEYVLKHVHYCRISDATMLMAVLHSLPDLLGDKKHECVKMVLLDSVAMPFRSLESAFVSECGQTNIQPANPTHASATWYQRKEAAGKRSRLIFMCSQLLHSHAVDHNLAVVVSNHVVSRALRITELNKTSSYRSTSGINHATVLLPALGESWGFGLSTRIILSHHHHHLPFDVVLHDQRTDFSSLDCPNAERDRRSVTLSPEQHRVARLVKGGPESCKEACFAITRKGIRDWSKKV